jgi:hypothetical protein
VDAPVAAPARDLDRSIRRALAHAPRGTPDGRKLVAEDTARFTETALAYPVAEYIQK